MSAPSPLIDSRTNKLNEASDSCEEECSRCIVAHCNDTTKDGENEGGERVNYGATAPNSSRR